VFGVGATEALLYRVARRWIAGQNQESLILDAKLSNGKGMGVMANYLGEDIKDSATADAHAQEYVTLQNALAWNRVRGCASVKLTQLGLGGNDSLAPQRLELLASNAERLDQYLWVDMESSAVTSNTLEIFNAAHAQHAKMGIAIQAYLHRSESDVKALLDHGTRIRLVKGAYREPNGIVFANRNEISKNYVSLLHLLFERGYEFAVGTHDSKLVEEAKRLAESKHVNFEFQFLKGIRDDLKEELVKSGYKVSEYLPYGSSWLAYSKRRLSEHPSNLWLLLRSLV
jgi:proline dehydrogenase